jgi:hypothetical protein
MSAIQRIQTANHLYEKAIRQMTPGRQCTLNVLGGALVVNQQSAAAGFQGDLTISCPGKGNLFDARA